MFDEYELEKESQRERLDREAEMNEEHDPFLTDVDDLESPQCETVEEFWGFNDPDVLSGYTDDLYDY